jgi:hypothetical protein
MLCQNANGVHKELKINICDAWNIVDEENSLDILILINLDIIF